jgi:hypothetical protein
MSHARVPRPMPMLTCLAHLSHTSVPGFSTSNGPTYIHIWSYDYKAIFFYFASVIFLFIVLQWLGYFATMARPFYRFHQSFLRFRHATVTRLFLVLWLSHFLYSVRHFLDFITRYIDSAILLQWLGYFEISSVIFYDFVSNFKILSWASVTRHFMISSRRAGVT